MNYCEELYFLKDNEKIVRKYQNDFLLFQIYSVPVIRRAYPDWLSTSWELKENTPEEIHQLIEKSPSLSDKLLNKRINEYYISRAIAVLSAYQACDTPITQDKTVPQNRSKLTSKMGDKALSVLKNAVEKGRFSDQMADLAIRTGHKFLADDKYYIRCNFSAKDARRLAISSYEIGKKEADYMFPAIQLTQGCLNNCSHCDSRATSHLSHMPWPLFRTLYRGLNKHYRHYRQEKEDFYFAAFFADSDMLDYCDPVMGVDSGDVGLWIKAERGFCQYLTRGVKNDLNRLALAKALYSGQPLTISFVDTPLENMSRNITQLDQTLDVIESVPAGRVKPHVMHLHPKSGGSVSPSVFRGYPCEDAIIYALGRAKNLPADEINHFPDEYFVPKYIFKPNGHLVLQGVKDGELELTTKCNLLQNQIRPQISPFRLFIRRHILPYFRDDRVR